MGVGKVMGTQQQRRNIGIFAHVDAGKTTTTERILYYSGVSHRIGAVDRGTAVMDWMAQEQDRGITITSAATKIHWQGCEINIIDTPGHVDFTAEVERSLRVLDGGVAIFDAVNGVEPQSETVWRQATRYHIPRLIFINKMDRVGADFDYVCRNISEELLNGHHDTDVASGRDRERKLLKLTIPVGSEREFGGVIDVLRQQLVEWRGDDDGRSVQRGEIPAELAEVAGAAYQELIEHLADESDQIAEQYLGGEAVGVGVCQEVIRRLTIAEMAFPVFCGASLRNIGVQPLMDGVVEYLPTPEELPYIIARAGHEKRGETAEVRVERSVDGPLSALIFKIAADRERGEIIYIRVYAGRVKSGDKLYNASLGIEERVNQLRIMHANSSTQVGEIVAGDIGTAVGLKHSRTGDTLTTRGNPHLLEEILFPQPVISSAIEPRSQSDRDHLLEVLQILRREDPTFHWKDDLDTGELVISGMGELHLNVLATRITDDFKVTARIGAPQVNYRERLQQTVSEDGSVELQLGGVEHRVGYHCSVGPAVVAAGIVDASDGEGEAAAGATAVKESDNQIIIEIAEEVAGSGGGDSGGGTVMPQSELAVVAKQAVEEILAAGFLLGYPAIQTRIAFTIDEVLSANPTLAVEAAVSKIVTALCQRADPVRLEPVMTVTVATPQECVGEVVAGLQQRGGVTTGITATHGGRERIVATAPLARLFGYSTAVRSATKGRGEFSIEFNRFAPVTPASGR